MKQNTMQVPARSLQIGDSLTRLGQTYGKIVSISTARTFVRLRREGFLTPDIFRADELVTIVPNPDLDRASSASVQHYIETGRYLTHTEVAEWSTSS